MAGFPFPLPNGWFKIGYADELEPGGVRPLRYFGRDLVLFRTEAGLPKLLDAHCPHLGAHIGHGGRVQRESIQCPFHGWRFDATGRCVEVPYAAKIPARAELRSWPLVERNLVLWAWYHAEGAPPQWQVPLVPEIGDPAWTPYKRFRWKIRTRNQETAENAVDRAHFLYVHGTRSLPETQTTIDGPVLNSVQIAKMETPRGTIEGRIETNVHGLGCSTIRFSGICDTVLVAGTAPIDDDFIDIRFSFSVKRENGNDTERGVGAAIIGDIVKQMNEDIPIWENKVFVERPVLCDGDGPIGPFRRWARQFYSEVGTDYTP